MARLFVDCRDYPSEKNCTVAISADSREELVDAAAQVQWNVRKSRNLSKIPAGPPAPVAQLFVFASWLLCNLLAGPLSARR
jgi:hypothetical protein